ACSTSAPPDRCDQAAGSLGERKISGIRGRNPRRRRRRRYLLASCEWPSRSGACAAGSSRITYNQMVVDQLSPSDIDRIFHALADSTRRDILTLTVGGSYSVSSL